MNDDVTLWGIHAGKTGNGDRLFKQKNIVALGWCDMPNLVTLQTDSPS